MRRRRHARGRQRRPTPPFFPVLCRRHGQEKDHHTTACNGSSIRPASNKAASRSHSRVVVATRVRRRGTRTGCGKSTATPQQEPKGCVAGARRGSALGRMTCIKDLSRGSRLHCRMILEGSRLSILPRPRPRSLHPRREGHRYCWYCTSRSGIDSTRIACARCHWVGQFAVPDAIVSKRPLRWLKRLPHLQLGIFASGRRHGRRGVSERDARLIGGKRETGVPSSAVASGQQVAKNAQVRLTVTTRGEDSWACRNHLAPHAQVPSGGCHFGRSWASGTSSSS